MIMLVYFSVCITSFLLITWIMVRTLNRSKYPPNNDDDGGMPGGNDFPIIDLPPGGKLEDLLVDRWYDDRFVASPKRS